MVEDRKRLAVDASQPMSREEVESFQRQLSLLSEPAGTQGNSNRSAQVLRFSFGAHLFARNPG
jgi:hypothetical protein